MRALLLALITLISCGDNGAAPEIDKTLAVTSDEPAGDNCTHGGTAISTGVDDNDDGLLSESEIDEIEYVCAPAPTLVSVVDEPGGENCPFGGQSISTGMDLNGNGELDIDEITDVTYVCDGTHGDTIDGSITIHNSIEASVLVGVVEITGNLVIDAPGMQSIDLSTLAIVGGNVEVAAYAGTLALPSLATIGGKLSWDTTSELTAPSLSSVGSLRLVKPAAGALDLSALVTSGDFEVNVTAPAPETVSVPQLTTTGKLALVGNADYAMPSLVTVGSSATPTAMLSTGRSLQAPGLTTVHGGLTVGTPTVSFPELQSVSATLSINNAATTSAQFPKLSSTGTVAVFMSGVTSIAFPSLQTTGGFSIAINSSLTSVTAPALATARSVTVTANPAITSLTFPSLTTIDESLNVGSNSALTQISLPVLATTRSVDFAGTQLVTVDLPELQTTGQISFSSTSMTTVSMPELVTATRIFLPQHVEVIDLGRLTTILDFTVSFQTSLRSLDLRALTDVTNTVDLSHTPALETISLPSLVHAHTIQIIESGAGSLDLGALQDCANLVIDTPVATLELGSLQSGSLLEISNTELSTVTLPGLTSTGALLVTNNSQLTSLNAPALTTMVSVRADANALLPTCVAVGIVDATSPTSVHIEGNLIDACGGATCIGNACI